MPRRPPWPLFQRAFDRTCLAQLSKASSEPHAVLKWLHEASAPSDPGYRSRLLAMVQDHVVRHKPLSYVLGEPPPCLALPFSTSTPQARSLSDR
jgi:hypothetical protein